MVDGLALTVRDHRFVVCTILLDGFWFMWVQLSISWTLFAQRWGTPTLPTPFGPLMVNGVAWIYGLNAGLTVLLQYPLLQLVERWLRPLSVAVRLVLLDHFVLRSDAQFNATPASPPASYARCT